eukprot:1138361-Pelagomonas_calceolata.AAC.2
MSIDPYSKLLNVCPQLCCKMGTVPLTNLNLCYSPLLGQQGNHDPMPLLEPTNLCCLEYCSKNLLE